MEQDGLRNLEDLCIQDHPPACVAACPIHVNSRAVAGEIARGDFAAAAKILKKAVPFPGITSRICDQPCQTVCKRGEAGAPVSIRALERACLDQAAQLQDTILTLPKKEKRVAIVGGGLSGLTAAFDLGKKGYEVVVFEKDKQLGGSLWRFSEEELPRQVIATDVAVLEKVGVEIRLGITVGKDTSFADLLGEFDAVYLALGGEPKETFALPLDQHGFIGADPVTFATATEGVFAGGGMHQKKHSHIQSIADGRRAATSIDRYLQNVSLRASRTNEGSFTTRLYTNTEGLEPLPTTPMADAAGGYSAEEAIAEARRCIQCECLECVKVCEYLNSFGSYPKTYVRQVYNNLSIVMGRRHANTLINSCSLCGLCQEVCPEDLHMGLVCKKARETLVSQGKMPPSAHEFPLRDMLFSNSETCSLAHHEPGKEASKFLFFPGCQFTGSIPQQIKKVYAILREKLTGGVGLMLRCCGAPADWSGRTELFQETLGECRRLWEQMGSPQLILSCSTCYEIFRTHLPEASIISLWEVLDRLGLPEPSNAASSATVVTIHDTCSTRYEKSIHSSVRTILGRLGFSIEELPLSRERTVCCGYGGLMFFANPELAKRAIQRRIEQSPADYVAYCAMCRDYFASRGKRTLHLLDLILGASADDAAARKAPSYSERQENRARLKQSILKELWGETVTEKERYETIRLRVAEDLREVLEQRQILDDDIRKVIEYAERTGSRLLNRQNGHLLAHHKPASVTYWVEYTFDPDGVVMVYNAYCHRMEIAEDIQ
ncbi:MAG TPA: FAD-dependent oxidoreductase [Thermodesulfobacteriota bacterium]|nr:FAD-dependent oxidoreductase [Thermodesulfobacteriota bacterium]HNU72352.1 FAD-dependent oxidoreductase [Thermodesulfobacteriota bacterium]